MSCPWSLHPSLYICHNQDQYANQTPPPTPPPTIGFFQRYSGADYVKQHERVNFGVPCYAPSGYLCPNLTKSVTVPILTPTLQSPIAPPSIR